MEKLSKEFVVLTWFFRGLEDIFFAFRINSSFRYEPYFNAMGFEMICKAYLLAMRADKYENLKKNLAINKVDELTRRWGHKTKMMVAKIKSNINEPEFTNVLSAKYDSYTGDQFVKIMESAYFECRYPVPNPIHDKFPVDGYSDMCREPLCSSGLRKFCFAFIYKIIIYLKEKCNIVIPKNEFDKIITGEAGTRFCNLFFKNMPNNFLES